MTIFCTHKFKKEFDRLMRKKSYNSLEKDLIDYFFVDAITPEKLRSGTNLTNSNDRPFIKKRIGGSGGFRCYYYLFIVDSKLYLTFVHPKSGAYGSSNTSKKQRKELIDHLIADILINNLIEVTKSTENKLVFKHTKKVQSVK